MSQISPGFQASFFLPRYWGTWLLLGIMRLGICLPFSWQIAIGKQIGNIFAALLAERKRISRTNLKLCFPELSEQEIKQLTLQSFQNAGISIFEAGMAWWAGESRLQALFSVKGMENIEMALANKEPILFLSGHFSSTEIGGRLLSSLIGYQALYKPARNQLYDYFMFNGRQHCRVISNNNTKTFIRNMKKGQHGWYAPDQNLRREEHVFVDFFSVPTLTVTATSRIANITGATVIPFYPIRRNNGYELIFNQAIKSFPSDDLEKDTRKVNAALEAGIEFDRAQYLWAHKRFHILPDGSKRQYT